MEDALIISLETTPTNDIVNDPKNGEVWKPNPNSNLKIVFPSNVTPSPDATPSPNARPRPDVVRLTIISDGPPGATTAREGILDSVEFFITIGTLTGDEKIYPSSVKYQSSQQSGQTQASSGTTTAPKSTPKNVSPTTDISEKVGPDYIFVSS